ncbi:type IV toxin-antitoxin system AbiEi family antitoxin domain-containing protein [Promicromonospora sp. CA-289599]|uniref:type IV toxin-antitoxin system AbiEi family antitoxin domain-containing protein n=1 Tax=Promicromonospora sp. CA-289599 TaxID=3240014 RepID=UPI003D8EB034
MPEEQVRVRLRVPAQRGEWVSPMRGLWVPVPPEFRTWGAPPGIEIVAAMMDYADARYYVGWLAAAELHGAAHQAPQVFQVATSKGLRGRQVGRTRFEFLTRSAVMRVPIERRVTRTGVVQISTVHTTMLDIAADVQAAAGMDNAATVIAELAEQDSFDPGTLVEVAREYPAAALQRIGWLLERFGDTALGPVADAVRERAGGQARLDPTRGKVGPLDGRWNVRLNTTVEPDL